MTKVENIEGQIRELSRDELTSLRQWFAEFDAELWDQQFEADVERGKLDRLAARARREHATGRSKKL